MAIDLLLVPGLLCDARLWHDQAACLAGTTRPVTFDITVGETIDDLAHRALAAMPGRFALAGLCMGGYVALAIMRLAPERVTHLCLMSTSARADTPQQARHRQITTSLVEAEPPERFQGVTPQRLRQIIHPDSLDDPLLVSEVTAMANRSGRDCFLRQQRAMASRPCSLGLLPRLRVPTLVVVGENDQLTPPELSREIASSIPDARLDVIETCGHLPPMERPDRVTTLLSAWLARSEPARIPVASGQASDVSWSGERTPAADGNTPWTPPSAHH